MSKVICSLPNAAELINGVKFIEHKLGMISEEISEEVAALFAKIPGYQVQVKEAASKAATKAAATVVQDVAAKVVDEIQAKA